MTGIYHWQMCLLTEWLVSVTETDKCAKCMTSFVSDKHAE